MFSVGTASTNRSWPRLTNFPRRKASISECTSGIHAHAQSLPISPTAEDNPPAPQSVLRYAAWHRAQPAPLPSHSSRQSGCQSAHSTPRLHSSPQSTLPMKTSRPGRPSGQCARQSQYAVAHLRRTRVRIYRRDADAAAITNGLAVYPSSYTIAPLTVGMPSCCRSLRPRDHPAHATRIDTPSGTHRRQSCGPKHSTSVFAIGRALTAITSRITPPCRVFAPHGSMAEG